MTPKRKPVAFGDMRGWLEGAGGGRGAARDQRRGRLEHRARHHRAAGARRRHRSGAAVQQHQGLQCAHQPLPARVQRRAVELSPHGHAARPAARRPSARAGQGRPQHHDRQHPASHRQGRAGEAKRHHGRRYRSLPVSGAVLEPARRRPLHHDLWGRRHQGSDHRRYECRRLSRHDREPRPHPDPDVARPAYRPSRHRLAAGRQGRDADRGRHRAGSRRSTSSAARRCRRAFANTTWRARSAASRSISSNARRSTFTCRRAPRS